MIEVMEELSRLPLTQFAAFMLLWTTTVTLIVLIICNTTTKHEIAELKQENMKLKYKNKQLEGFAAAYQEEKDKEYVRGYYDSIGVYDI